MVSLGHESEEQLSLDRLAADESLLAVEDEVLGSGDDDESLVEDPSSSGVM